MQVIMQHQGRFEDINHRLIADIITQNVSSARHGITPVVSSNIIAKNICPCRA